MKCFVNFFLYMSNCLLIICSDLILQNSLLEFARVLKAKEQVVAGKMYHLTLEVIDAGKKKIYEAKVWVKPWMNFKELQEFKHAHDDPSFSQSDLGAERGNLLLQSVPKFLYFI